MQKKYVARPEAPRIATRRAKAARDAASDSRWGSVRTVSLSSKRMGPATVNRA
jgi:hypothetical protein